MNSHISALFFGQMKHHFVENFKAVILVPYPGHLDKNWRKFTTFTVLWPKNAKNRFFFKSLKKNFFFWVFFCFSVKHKKTFFLRCFEMIWNHIICLKKNFRRFLPKKAYFSADTRPNNLIFCVNIPQGIFKTLLGPEFVFSTFSALNQVHPKTGFFCFYIWTLKCL